MAQELKNKVISAQIIGYTNKSLVMKTITGQIVQVHYELKTEEKRNFYQTILKDIMLAGLWIPLDTQNN
ncbi:hypothetical protein LFYK43_05210 [Ligilactobacillus salitolerans]|uniref:Uncharacterized protein n=1 Tax=Ligilactobacillus salitolerans TaxID=1808352 RepID=A0A401IRA3_9LACO|nr:hypothetical protein LFYK43_05210 [Ligilactobacillus salitolerans]